MQAHFKILILTLVALTRITCAYATHIVGGEMTYTYLGNNQYKLKLSLFVDCINGNIDAINTDAVAIFAIFNGSSNAYITQYNVNRTGPIRIAKEYYNCLTKKPNACVDKYEYEKTITLAANTGGYYISFQRCCRNNSITNLINPGATGANYWTKIPPVSILSNGVQNNSAIFKELPPNYICTNTLLKFDQSATDPDGDSLSYELFLPYLGGNNSNNVRPSTKLDFEKPLFTNVQFKWPYSYTRPITGSPDFSINSKTGLMTVNPNVTGQFVVGIKVKEWRNNVLIGETKRDYQFNIQSCEFDLVASYFKPNEICNYKYTFINKSLGATSYLWDFGDATTNADTSIVANPTYTFPGPGTYTITLVAKKNNCIDTIQNDIEVASPIKPSLGADQILCPGKTATATVNPGGQQYEWNTGETTQSIQISKEGTYIAAIVYKSCKWYDTVKYILDKTTLQLIGDTFYCSTDAFNRHVYVKDSALQSSITWNDGYKLYSRNTTKPVIWTVATTNKNGCQNFDTVKIEQYPPIIIPPMDTVVCANTTVTFDSKNNLGTVTWDNGTVGPTAQYTKPGNYSVTVIRTPCKLSQNFELTNFPFTLELGPDKKFCDLLDTIVFVPDIVHSNPVWNRSIASKSLHITQPGKQVLELINQYGCPESDSFTAFLYPSPSLNLQDSLLVCLSTNPVLDAGPDMESYKWNNGESTQKVIAYDAGIYWVQILSKNGCYSRDSVIITKNPNLHPSIAYMPNAFSPNNNGRNDVYPDNKYFDFGEFYNLRIYNRWGQKLLEYNGPSYNWDGTINGEPAPDGVYVYLLHYLGCDNQMHKISGSFHLMR